APIIQIVNVTSDQTAMGRSASRTADEDVVFGPAGFCIRAERAGGDKNGRVYTVTGSVTDASGNSTLATGQIRVAHDQPGHHCPPAHEKFIKADNDPSCSPEALAAPLRRR